MDVIRSSMDAPFMMAKYSESLLHYTFVKYVYMNVYYKLASDSHVAVLLNHVALLHNRCIYEHMSWFTCMCVSKFMCL